MSIQFALAKKIPARTALHAVGVTREQVTAGEGFDAATLAAASFEGDAGQSLVVPGEPAPVLLIGLGPAADVSVGSFRRAGAALARRSAKHARVSTSLLDAVPEGIEMTAAAAALAEGVVLGNYGYLAHKSDPKPSKLATVTVVGAGGARVTEALAHGATVAEAVNLARDLVNEPGGSLTPSRFADLAVSATKGARVRVEIMDLAAIKRARLGGLLGVNRGSTQQPRFVKITYTPTGRSKGHVALVGKGVTFDSGGLSLKTGQGMMTMKCDMAGAAAVVATMAALRDLAPPVKVSAFVPLTDNMTGGDATRPGDVLTMRNKKTVEVLNTDAEGRLILADALSLASEAKPDAIIDLATLTGACMVALGTDIAGLMGNDDDLRDRIEAAADRTGEPVWRLPLPRQYRKLIDSPVADIKNIGGPHGGTLTAGLFLEEFVADGIPWAHLDIAGPAFKETDGDDHPKGATGYAVRLLVDLVEHW